MPHNPLHTPSMNKPDPAVKQAIAKLQQTQLSPLEEQLFVGWMAANGMDAEKMGNSDSPIDFRHIYKESNGKVMPTGQLQKQVEKQSAIDTIMKAQEAHNKMSPVQMMMEAMEGKQNIPDENMESPGMGSSGMMGGGMDNSNPSGYGGV